MEKYLTYRVVELEKKLEAYKRGVDTLSSSDESQTETSSDSDSSEEENSDEVIVDERWEYSNTI